MCAGGQDIPVTLRVDGGIEDGQWKSANDVLDTPAPQEDVQVTEATETEVMEPSAPLYKPVIERIDKLSERLPEKVAEETFEEVSPMMQHGFQMADRNQMNTMQMLDRIMRNTRPRKRFPPRGDGPLGKGGGRNDPRVPRPRYQNLGATPQVAGLVGLLAKPQEPTYNKRTLGDPNIGPMNFPKQQGATPMQPEVIEEQQQMEILGQPKQFAGGGIVNALMATPIGQAELRKYATGGEIKFGDYIFDYGPTGDDPLDILRGRIYDDGRKARFFSSEAHMKDPSEPVVNWGRKEIVEQITEDLTPQRRKKKKEEPHDGDSQVTGHEPDIDPVTGVQVGYLSEIDFDPNDPSKPGKGPMGGTIGGGFKDYVDVPPLGLGGLILGLIQKGYQKSLEYKEPKDFKLTEEDKKFVHPSKIYGKEPYRTEKQEKETWTGSTTKGAKANYGMGIGSEEDDPRAAGFGNEGGRPEDRQSLKTPADYEKAYQEMVDKSKTGTKTEPTLPSPHLTLDAGKKTTVKSPVVASTTKQLTTPPTKSPQPVRAPTKVTPGEEDAKAPPARGLTQAEVEDIEKSNRDIAKGLVSVAKVLGLPAASLPPSLPVLPSPMHYDTPGKTYDHTRTAPGLFAAAQTSPFGHTADGFWSQTDDDGVMGGDLTDAQLGDIASQIDTFSEVTAEEDIGGGGGEDQEFF